MLDGLLGVGFREAAEAYTCLVQLDQASRAIREGAQAPVGPHLALIGRDIEAFAQNVDGLTAQYRHFPEAVRLAALDFDMLPEKLEGGSQALVRFAAGDCQNNRAKEYLHVAASHFVSAARRFNLI